MHTKLCSSCPPLHNTLRKPALEARYISTTLHGVTSLKTAIFTVIAISTTNPLACMMHYPQDWNAGLTRWRKTVLELHLCPVATRDRWRCLTEITTNLGFKSNHRARWLQKLILYSLQRWHHNPIYTIQVPTNDTCQLIPNCRADGAESSFHWKHTLLSTNTNGVINSLLFSP